MVAATGDGSHEQRQVPTVLRHIGALCQIEFVALLECEQPFSTINACGRLRMTSLA